MTDTSKEAVKYWSEMIRFSERGSPALYKYDPDYGLLSRFIEALAAERDAATERAEKAKAELTDISAAIGTVRFMDPPDGGDVSLAEQVRRMRAALDKAELDAESLDFVLNEGGPDSLLMESTRLKARVAALEGALTPDGDTKASYIGEFKFSITLNVEDEDGEPQEIQHQVYVPWDTTKEIMAAIQNYAALSAAPAPNSKEGE